MSTLPKAMPPDPAGTGAPAGLHSGDRMSREEFHRLYEEAPPEFKAELVGGVVYVASPVGHSHCTSHPLLATLLTLYEGSTPGTEVGDNGTILMGEEGEPQPDLYLRVLPGHGGQSRTVQVNRKTYVAGAPELIAEIAYSSRSIDLHAKRRDYHRYGVLEYLVLSLEDRRLYWFDLRTDAELSADADGVVRVRCFPGLWIDGPALVAHQVQRAIEVLSQGLSAPDHAGFVQRLATAKGS